MGFFELSVSFLNVNTGDLIAAVGAWLLLCDEKLRTLVISRGGFKRPTFNHATLLLLDSKPDFGSATNEDDKFKFSLVPA